jgi:opacity protein-like surface antigen
MKKLLVGAALAVSMLAAAPAANAAQYIDLTPPGADGSITGVFGDSAVAAGNFSHVFNFVFPANGAGGATISSILTLGAPSTDINFTSVWLNGKELNLVLDGDVEFRSLFNTPITGGPQKLEVNGWSGGNGSYSGTLTFGSAVPEPATWAMMIIGFTGAGVAIRRRRSDATPALA